MKQFLSFVYTDHFDDTTFSTVSRLIPLAEKYNVRRLASLCGQSLLASMNAENVSEIAVIGQVRERDRVNIRTNKPGNRLVFCNTAWMK